MNCRDTESLLYAERDGVLTTTQHAAFEQHVANCADCRQMRAHLTAALEQMQRDAAAVTVPSAEEEWHTLRARLNSTSAAPGEKRPLAPLLWFGAPLAAAAVVALAFFNTRSPAPDNGETAQAAEVAKAEFVETGDANASTMVYVDKESGWLVVWTADSKNEGSG